jgi:hypothetical protein
MAINQSINNQNVLAAAIGGHVICIARDIEFASFAEKDV